MKKESKSESPLIGEQKCTKPDCDCIEQAEKKAGGPVKNYECLKGRFDRIDFKQAFKDSKLFKSKPAIGERSAEEILGINFDIGPDGHLFIEAKFPNKVIHVKLIGDLPPRCFYTVYSDSVRVDGGIGDLVNILKHVNRYGVETAKEESLPEATDEPNNNNMSDVEFYTRNLLACAHNLIGVIENKQWERMDKKTWALKDACTKLKIHSRVESKEDNKAFGEQDLKAAFDAGIHSRWFDEEEDYEWKYDYTFEQWLATRKPE